MDDPVRVLHVDDDPSFTDMTARFLRRESDRFEVVEMTRGADAIERLREADDRIDCVVSDYALPDMDGIDVLETVREAYPDLPVIIFTGRGSEEVAGEALRAGATDYLQKESGVEQYAILANRILNAVEKYRTAESEGRLLELAENTDQVLFVADAGWNEILYVNAVYEEIFGRPVEALREDPLDFLEGVHPDHRETVRDAMERASAGESVEAEYRVDAGEGYHRWVRGIGEPIRDGGGEVVRVAGFVTDITAEKRKERELERNEARYRSLTEDVLDASPIGIFIIDADSEVVWCNAAVGEFLGLDREAVIGEDKRRLIREEIKFAFEDPDRFAERVLGTYEENSPSERFRCHVLPGEDREERWLEHWSTPIESGLYEGGRIEHYTDITEHERERERMGARLRALAETLPDGTVHHFDDELRYAYVAGAGAGAGFGRIDVPPGDLEGKTIHEVEAFPAGVVEALGSLMEATLAGNEETAEVSYAGRVYELRSVPVREADGEVTGGFYIARDVTERRP